MYACNGTRPAASFCFIFRSPLSIGTVALSE